MYFITIELMLKKKKKNTLNFNFKIWEREYSFSKFL